MEEEMAGWVNANEITLSNKGRNECCFFTNVLVYDDAVPWPLLICPLIVFVSKLVVSNKLIPSYS